MENHDESNENCDDLVELTRVFDAVEADLLGAFLDDGGLEFEMVRSAATLAGLMPATEVAVQFFVHKPDLEQAKDLLTEYRKEQTGELPPSDFPPPYEGVDEGQPANAENEEDDNAQV